MTPGELRSRHAVLAANAADLARMPLRERARAIGEAVERLQRADAPEGCSLRAELLRTTGLSLPNLELGLATTLALFTPDALVELVEATPASEGRPRDAARTPCTVVLAGNVWSAAARPLLLPLACGIPVLAKAATGEAAFPRALTAALRSADACVGDACDVVAFGRDEPDLLDALLERSTPISAYGADDTLAAIAARVPEGARFVAHGHGLGLVCLGAEALASPAAVATLCDAIALDVAAYDQRGCLSPHAVLVESGGAVDARAVAVQLAAALEAIQARIPLGSEAGGAAEAMQWRGVVAATGDLFAHAHGAAAFLGEAELRASPGRRHVAVHACRDVHAMRTRLKALGGHLKALGVAGARTHAALAELAPYVCAPGRMQSPPLDAKLDGLHPLAGYLD